MSVLDRRTWERELPSSRDKVFVKDLAFNAHVGKDGWGRTKKQPVQISVTLSLTHAFDSAAERDEVDQSTVHYGTLSKNIIEAVERRGNEHLSLEDLASMVDRATEETVGADSSVLQAYEVSIFLPKASLLGVGVSLESCWARGLRSHLPSVLHLKHVRVATAVGVNDYEKKAKQLVVSSLWIDPMRGNALECYGQLEQILVKTIEETLFETLESLATTVVSMLIKHFIFRISPGADVRLRVEKPSAVSLAAAPGVEIVRRSDYKTDPFASRLWSECGERCPEAIPYPLLGRLDEYLQS